jgi:N-acetylglucosaminyldiphosphoundecaprenol N-acetyl-beta-D-mannosaminyltransferase
MAVHLAGATEVPGFDAGRVRLGTLSLTALDRRRLTDGIFSDLEIGRGGWVVTANVDFLQRAGEDAGVTALYERATLIVADGAPLVWASRLRGTPLPERVAGSDLFWDLCIRAEATGRSVFLLGGAPGAAQRASAVLLRGLPTLRLAGVDSPSVSAPPTPAQVQELAARVVRARPDIVFVALGSPKQEQVIEAIRASLPSAWMLGVGITFSYVAGDVKRAPRWLQQIGLEWAHRYLRRNLPYALGLLTRSSLIGLGASLAGSPTGRGRPRVAEAQATNAAVDPPAPRTG